MAEEQKKSIINESRLSEKDIGKSIENKSSSSPIKSDVVDKDKKETEKTKEKKPEKPKKTEAIVNGKNLPISTKYAVAVCNYIRGGNIDKAISMLEQVAQFKKAVPMKGEIAHRKGRIMSGKYPIKAVKEFMILLKSLKVNAIVNELELEKYVVFCKADVAPRPYRRFGRTRFKRTHVTLKLILPKKKIRKEVKK